MLVLLPGILGSLLILIAVATVYAIGVVINKIALSLLCAKYKVRLWGLLWIPNIHGWIEGGMVSRLISRKDTPNRVFQILWTLIHIAPLACYIAFSFVAPSHYDPKFDELNFVWECIYCFTLVLKAIFRTIALTRNGRKIGAFVWGVFLSPFWSFGLLKNRNK